MRGARGVREAAALFKPQHIHKMYLDPWGGWMGWDRRSICCCPYCLGYLPSTEWEVRPQLAIHIYHPSHVEPQAKQMG